MQNLQTLYYNHLKSEGFNLDPIQEQAVGSLQRLLKDITKKRSFFSFGRAQDIKGVYLHGGVGRGKSMVMDLFFDAVPKNIKKRRIHFHEFMIETHDWLHKYRGEGMADLLPSYADDVAKNIKVLCFDEFHVVDVADAMILGRLFTALLERGVTVVATSNWQPDRLYEGGLQRELFLPFIALLKERLEIIHLDNDTDYRQFNEADANQTCYFSPLDSVASKLFQDKLIEISNAEKSTKTITVKGRNINVNAYGECAYFTFADLCESAMAAEDYLAITKEFHTLFLDDVPRIGATNKNEAKRFILLIDCLYEAKAKLYMRSEVHFAKLYEGADHGFEFDRTFSRLTEMQSADWLAE